MANVTLSPNMNLPVPVVGQDPGPDWANNINSSLGILDQHDHTPGKGIQIVPSAININADLAFNSNNATLLKSSRYVSNVSPLSAISPNLQCVYVSGVDLYYNDGNGNQIRITSSGAVTGAAGTITGLPSGTASAVFSAIQGTFVFQQATNTAAAVDMGSAIIRYAGSYPVPSGNYIALQAPSTLATGYAFTLPTTTPINSNSFLTSSSSGAISYITTDNSTLQISGSNIQVQDGGITKPKMAAFSVTPSNLVLTTNITGSVGSPQTITTATITSYGRPILITLGAFDNTQDARIVLGNTSNPTQVYFYISRGATQLGIYKYSTLATSSSLGLTYPGNLTWFDPTVSAGTYTYTLFAYIVSGTAQINGVRLAAVEL